MLLSAFVGAAAFFAGPFGGAGRSEEEADGSHGPGAPAGGGPVERHPERTAKGDGTRSVIGDLITTHGLILSML